MRVAIDKNADGIIDNIIEVESLELAATLFPSDAVLDAVEAGVKIGWIKDGNIYVAPPEPDPVYRAVTQVEFVRLCMGAGGMTTTMLVACKNDENMQAFWIMFGLAKELHKDDPEIEPGLGALAALGYLPNGAQAVLDGWPV